MVFKCQEDSFLKEFISTVVSCEKTTNEDYEVILEDTILFPEGGGQPCDHGYLNDKKVQQVLRRGSKAVHFIKEPIAVGEKVTQTVDWNRRFDHMQQHSGQHLITAIFDREFQFATISWYMGEEVAYIELETPKVTENELMHVEKVCNECIREHRTVSVNCFDENTPEKELDNFRSARGLPADHSGPIRVVTIQDIESNMCCGTHVTNLSQLQAVKLLYAEKSKRKDKTLLYFLVGNRVLNRFEQCLKRENKLTALLKTNPVQHPEFVEKALQSNKNLNKNLQSALKELAVYEAEKIKNCKEKYIVLHRKGADSSYINLLLKEGGRTDIFQCLSVGEDKGAGSVVLYGDERAISELSTKICDLLGGKGSGQGNKFQAKVTKMENLKHVVKLIEGHFK